MTIDGNVQFRRLIERSYAPLLTICETGVLFQIDQDFPIRDLLEKLERYAALGMSIHIVSVAPQGDYAFMDAFPHPVRWYRTPGTLRQLIATLEAAE